MKEAYNVGGCVICVMDDISFVISRLVSGLLSSLVCNAYSRCYCWTNPGSNTVASTAHTNSSGSRFMVYLLVISSLVRSIAQ